MRSRIYELPNGRYVVIWETRRNFRTREEAQAASQQPLPTEMRGPVQIDPGILQLAARLHDEVNFSWEAVATALSEAGLKTPMGGQWHGGNIAAAVRRARAKRAEHDRAAVHSEWHVPDG